MKEENDKKVEAMQKAIQKETDLKIHTIQKESELKAKETIAKEKQKNIDKGKKMLLIEMCNKFLENNYKEKDNDWLNSCTIEQLRKVFELTQEKEKCSYKDLMKTIFSTSKGAYAAGR